MKAPKAPTKAPKLTPVLTPAPTGTCDVLAEAVPAREVEVVRLVPVPRMAGVVVCGDGVGLAMSVVSTLTVVSTDAVLAVEVATTVAVLVDETTPEMVVVAADPVGLAAAKEEQMAAPPVMADWRSPAAVHPLRIHPAAEAPTIEC